MKEILNNILDFLKIDASFEKIIDYSQSLLIAILLATLSYLITKKIIMYLGLKLVKLIKIKTKWDDYFIGNGLLKKISFLVPLVVLEIILDKRNYYVGMTEKEIKTGYIVVYIMIAQSLLDGIADIYNTFEVAKKKPIKSYIQIIKIMIILLGILIFLTILFDKSPVALLGGFGAMTAILLLVFKDILLGFVASIQLAVNNLVSIEDWIEMPSQDANGYVKEINLTNVKVQNWDNTIVTIPSYSLVSQSFKNWKGMETSGGRRIKRNLFLDLHTVKFLEIDDILRLKESKYLSEYFDTKEKELNEYNKEFKGTINERRLTNIGTFRVYIENYLKENIFVDIEKPILVRQLQANHFGIPLEIYCFANIISWVEYEKIQSDIFDHLIAIVGEFGLSIYQIPSGGMINGLEME